MCGFEATLVLFAGISNLYATIKEVLQIENVLCSVKRNNLLHSNLILLWFYKIIQSAFSRQSDKYLLRPFPKLRFLIKLYAPALYVLTR